MKLASYTLGAFLIVIGFALTSLPHFYQFSLPVLFVGALILAAGFSD